MKFSTAVMLAITVIWLAFYGFNNLIVDNIHFDFWWGEKEIQRPTDYRYSFSIKTPDGKEIATSKAFGSAGITSDGVLFKNIETGEVLEYIENGGMNVYRGERR